MRILVVDDNPDVATMLAELLKLDGHEEVTIAERNSVQQDSPNEIGRAIAA